MDYLESQASEAEWEIWHQDMFDRERPRQVEIAGRGLVDGLMELWRRHLFETVKPDGGKGFSRFNLWWKLEQKSIEVVGDWQGQVQLRRWVFGATPRRNMEDVDEGGKALLHKIAVAHKEKIMRGKTSEEILAIAKSSVSREEFEKQLLSME